MSRDIWKFFVSILGDKGMLEMMGALGNIEEKSSQEKKVTFFVG
jgi:hypothetical protein